LGATGHGKIQIVLVVTHTGLLWVVHYEFVGPLLRTCPR